MKALSGGLITNSAAACAYISQYENVLPIWGIQRESELEEFISYMSNTPEMNKEMRAIVEKDRKELLGDFCRGCGYCMPCPKGVDIPGTFAAYNRRYSEGKASGFLDYIICTALRKNASCASNCVGCGKCEKHCPQGIPIRTKLNEAKKELETPLFKIAFKFIKKFTNF